MIDRPGNDKVMTGRWQGHYVQHGAQHRIIADIVQDENRITGQMTDLDNVTEQSLYDAIASARLPPGTDERIAEEIRQLIPNAGKGAITSKSILPNASTVSGTIGGEFVRFTKQYQGNSFRSFQIDDQAIGHAIEGHSVEYSGRLSSDGETLSGRWTIYESCAPQGFIDGGFELRRLHD